MTTRRERTLSKLNVGNSRVLTEDHLKVAAMLKARGITNVKAIAFKSAEGWELTGNQSYKTEARPAGRFLGDYANATAAWAANYQGVPTVAGDYYWQTSGTIGLFECTTSNASAQRYRGGSSHMPLEACFVASGSTTTSRLRVFDLTDPLMSMWMEFRGEVAYLWTLATDANFTSVDLSFDNGALYATKYSGSNALNVNKYDFQKDEAFYHFPGGSRLFSEFTKYRNTTPVLAKSIGSTGILALPAGDHAVHNGYYAVPLVGRVCVIKPDNTLIYSSSTNAFKAVAILNGRLYAVNDTASPEQLIDFGPIESLGASFAAVNTWTNATVPALSAATLNALGIGSNSLLLPSASAVDQLWPNTAVLADSLIARRGTTFATPPMKKPEVMLICSTVGGAISGTPIFNDDFNGSIASYSSHASAALTNEAGTYLRATLTTTTSLAGAFRTATVIVGKRYKFTCDIVASGGSASGVAVRIYNDTVGGTYVNETSAGVGAKSVTFHATATTVVFAGTMAGVNGSYADFDNFRLEEIGEDFSGKSNHATINGTLTATAEVAGGVALLSGFTVNTNNLNSANPWVSIGTGEGWIGGVFKTAASAVFERLVQIGYWDGAAMQNAVVRFEILDDSRAYLRVSNADATSVSVTTTSTYDDGLVHTFIIKKTATQYELEIDGRQVGAVAVGSHGNLTFHASASLFVGRNVQGTSVAPNTGIALIGAGKTALTDEEVSLMHTHMRNLIVGKAALDEIPTALAYDPIRKAVEMVGATRRQTLQDGAITASVLHGQGTSPVVAVGPRSEIGIGGTTGVSVSVPERNLREYQARLTKERFTVKYAGNATASRVLFPDPATAVEMAVTLDAKPVRVSNAGVVQTEGTSDDYTVKDYGLGRYVVQFAVAPADGNDVLIEFGREVWK